MGAKTGIEWTDATWNPVRGCSRVSEGCRYCYAEKIAARFSDEGQPFHLFADRAKSGSKWTGKVGLVKKHLCDPLKWRKPRRIFVNSMSDLFHEALGNRDIDRVFAVISQSPQHTFQILTKRPHRMRDYIAAERTPDAINDVADDFDWCHANTDGRWPLPNLWLGVSVEDQATADSRIPLLLQTPAAKRFISYEPALGPVNLGLYLCRFCADSTVLDWVICGGESGPSARPMSADWARLVRDDCQAFGVPFLFKQWGEWLPGKQDGSRDFTPQALNCWDGPIKVGKKAAGALLDGREWKEFPDGRV
jgi:protein gp37